MGKLFSTLFTASVLLALISLATFHACKKEKIIIQGSRTDTIYVQYDHCQYDTSLPINCYTTHLRGSAQRLGAGGGVDTLELTTLQYVTLGHCEFDKFVPLYVLRVYGIFPGRIPDTAMCRAAGLPLCCPSYNTNQPCFQATEKGDPLLEGSPNDISSAFFQLIDFCDRTNIEKFSFNIVGQTQYLLHPDSNPNLQCSQHLQALFQNSCQAFNFRNCTVRLIDIPKRFEPDTITVVYLPQADGYYTTPCCAAAFKESSGGLFQETVKIELQCD